MRFALGLLCALFLAAPALADPVGAVLPGNAGSQSDLQGCYVFAATPAPIANQQVAVPCQSFIPAVGITATIVTGGTAVTVVTGPVNGGYIVNPLNTAAQGVTAENAYIDPVASPGSTDAAANGTTNILQAGQVYTIPPLQTGSVVKANAATSGHKLTVVVW